MPPWPSTTTNNNPPLTSIQKSLKTPFTGIFRRSQSGKLWKFKENEVINCVRKSYGR